MSTDRREIAFLVHEVAPLVAADLHRRLEERGHHVPSSYRYVFRRVEPAGTAVSVLAAASGVTTQAVSRVVHDMEARGLASRSPDPDDARVSVVRLTDAGERLRQAVLAAHAAAEAEWAADLGADALEVTRATLQAVRTRLTGGPST